MDTTTSACLARMHDLKVPSCLKALPGSMDGSRATFLQKGFWLSGKDAVIEGNIAARSVHCAGTVTGDIVASERVELVPPAFVTGRVKTPRLSLQEGVSFLGVSEVQNVAAALTGPSGRGPHDWGRDD